MFLFPTIMLLGLLYYVMGLVVVFLKPNAPASWCLFLFGSAVALSLAGSAEINFTHLTNFPQIGVPVIGPSVLLISLYFPVEMKSK